MELVKKFLLKNMYEKNKLSVCLLRGITEFFPSNAGLKQGYNTIPLLFNVLIDNINGIFDECFCHPDTLGNLKLRNLL